MRRLFGPSTLLTAAFIGPGTVTVCTLAGAQAGYSLLWVLLFSVTATLLLQEMTGRLGLVTQQGFGEAIRQQLQHPLARTLAIVLVLSAVVIGNAAYEGGNIAGAALGLDGLLFPGSTAADEIGFSIAPVLIGTCAWLILGSGRFQLIQRSLLALVVLMSFVFLTTAVMVRPDWEAVGRGLFIPSAGEADWLLAIALLGTTVVPYNLFLHASVIKERYHQPEQLSDMRVELASALLVGGLISMSIVISSAASLFGVEDVESAADMAVQLEPLLGSLAPIFIGMGLLAAGVSSAITAPLAAAYTARGILGWDPVRDASRFRLVWQGILLIGVLVASLGWSPILIIQFAQLANGILLPVVAVFLLIIMNRRALLGNNTNSLFNNLCGAAVVLIALLLGWRSMNNVFQFVG